jgi:hypothetical protein
MDCTLNLPSTCQYESGVKSQKNLGLVLDLNSLQTLVMGHRLIFIIDHGLESVATSIAISLIIILKSSIDLSILESLIFNLDFMFFLQILPVRIRVRIDPPHPLVCHKRRLNGAVLRIRPEKLRSHVTVDVAR